MKSKVVWVTSEEVRILTMGGGEAEVLRQHGPRHHKETLGRNHPQGHDDVERFMHEVATKLDAEPARLLLVGPAQAKIRLKNHIDREHPKVAKSVVGVETMDKATEGEVLHFARNFFTKLNAFEAI